MLNVFIFIIIWVMYLSVLTSEKTKNAISNITVEDYIEAYFI